MILIYIYIYIYFIKKKQRILCDWLRCFFLMKLLLCIIDTLSSLPGRSKYSRIFSCPDGITPNSGLTGLSILDIYIYMYVCMCVCGNKRPFDPYDRQYLTRIHKTLKCQHCKLILKSDG